MPSAQPTGGLMMALMNGLPFAAMFQSMCIVFAVLYTATYDGNVVTTESLTILQRMELMLNASITSINGRLNTTSQNMQSMETRIDLLSETQKTTLNELYKKLNPSSLPRSCVEVLEISSGSPSGYYTLADPNGYPYSVYCYMDNFCNAGGGWKRVAKLDMKNSNENCPAELRLYHQDGKRACGRLVSDRVCGKVIGYQKGFPDGPDGGGWKRVAKLDMKNSNENCPGELRLYHQDGKRACGRPVSDSGGCSGTIFPVNYEYSQVCGKVLGYQKGHPDGLYQSDRVSLTHGTSQSHIWSFIPSGSEGLSDCPCSSSPRNINAPTYIGSDYYCESAENNGLPSDFNHLYTNDPLWDGQNCRSSEAGCCKRPLIPWFHKKFGYTTTDYIEMRFCFNEGTHDEDSPVFQYEIYVK
uniref:Fibrinogen C-terminal domain-containing protein n=1 Tax=Amphimedon queenslandica TaxID=400682 RepID=A0A1X7VN79_AMPQE